MNVKMCTKCQQSKPLEEYHRLSKSRDGHRPDCKTCRNLQQVEYRRPHRTTRLWVPDAERMLSEGASYHEVARTLKIDVRTVSREFPAQGWTKQQGVEYRKMKQKMDAL